MLPVQPRFVRPSSIRSLELAEYPTRPIDYETGLPLCFYPNPDLPEIVEPNIERRADWDHQYTKVATKNGQNPILDLPGARYGLMHLRVQWSLYEDHHAKWNAYKYIAPKQPGTPEQLAATMVLGLAGCIPPVALQLGKVNFKKVLLRDSQRKTLWASGQVRSQYDEEILTYLRWYVVNQRTDHIKTSQLEEYISTENQEKRMELGLEIAGLLMERATEPFNATYARARKRRLLHVRTLGSETRPPDTAKDFLHLKLADENRASELVAHTFRAVRASLAA